VSNAFHEKNPVQRQRLIYKAIWDELEQGHIHAIDSVVAKTPQEDSS
jgi:acid stress-induced BolA-like protein IbaG/YrbA